MVHVNANLDQVTNKILRTGQLNKTLGDLCEEPLYITFVARDQPFNNEAWQEGADHFIRVVLPYDEVLQTDNIDLLASQRLLHELPLLDWLDVEGLQERLRVKMVEMD